MFYQILHSPQVKRCAIITYKHDMNELSHNLLNGLRLKILVFWNALSENLGLCANWGFFAKIRIFLELYYSLQQ